VKSILEKFHNPSKVHEILDDLKFIDKADPESLRDVASFIQGVCAGVEWKIRKREVRSTAGNVVCGPWLKK
jgi:hypothetical protein